MLASDAVVLRGSCSHCLSSCRHVRRAHHPNRRVRLRRRAARRRPSPRDRKPISGVVGQGGRAHRAPRRCQGRPRQAASPQIGSYHRDRPVQRTTTSKSRQPTAWRRSGPRACASRSRCRASRASTRTTERKSGAREPWDGRRDAFRQSADESKGLMHARRYRRSARRLEEQGTPRRISRLGGDRRHAGAQAARHLQGRRHRVPLPRSRQSASRSASHERATSAASSASARPTSASTSRSAACGCRSRSSPAAKGGAAQPARHHRARRGQRRRSTTRFPVPGRRTRRSANRRRRRGRHRRRRAPRPPAAKAHRAALDGGLDLRARRAQHRLGRDERARGGARAFDEAGKTTRLRRRRVGRRVEVDRRRHDVQAGVRQAAGAIDRRDRRRSVEPETVWVGTGESWTRNSVSIGDGIYKSTDGGETWTNMGLPESERDHAHHRPSEERATIVYACVPGQAVERQRRSRPVQDDRRRQDAGRSCSRAATCRPAAPASRSIPKNPDVAVRRDVGLPPQGLDVPLGRRRPERAERQRRCTARPTAARRGRRSPKTEQGPARRPVGPHRGRDRAVRSRRSSTRFIESKDSALYRFVRRRRDLGSSATRASKMVWRPFYFARLDRRSDATPNRVFKPDLGLIVSDDGGKSFSRTRAAARTATGTTCWIDPTNTQAHHRRRRRRPLDLVRRRQPLVEVEQPADLAVLSRERRRPKIRTRSTAGCRTTARGSATRRIPGGITNSRWENLFGGDGFWAIVDPTDPRRRLRRVAGRLHRRASIARTHVGARYPAESAATRRSCASTGTRRSTPARRRRARSTSARSSCSARATAATRWERISPDLTTNDPEKQKQEQSGGVTVDNSSAEMHTTIYSISESPKNANVIWVGTDDGNVQLTRDGGKTWTNVVAQHHRAARRRG